MKVFEKSAVAMVILTFLLQFSSFGEKEVLFRLASFSLTLSYILGGYWLIESPSKISAVISGIGAGVAVLTLPNALKLRIDEINYTFIYISVGILVCLITTRLIWQNKWISVSMIARNGIIVMVILFVNYPPETSKVYRNFIKAINFQDARLMSNLSMFDYAEKYKEAISAGNCDLAIENAESSKDQGLNWLGLQEADLYSSVNFRKQMGKFGDSRLRGMTFTYSSQNQINKMGGTFENLYWAYKCRSEGQFEKGRLKPALKSYVKALRYLRCSPQLDSSWTVEIDKSLKEIEVFVGQSAIGFQDDSVRLLMDQLEYLNFVE